MKPINVIALERSRVLSTLVDVLRGLRFDVAIAEPGSAPLPCDAGRSIAYLGPRPWPERTIDSAVSADLLAVGDGAFDWIGPQVERASDFLTWPCSTRELVVRLRRNGFSTHREREAPERRALSERAAEMGMIGRSPVFVDALVTLRQFAQSDATVLIEGETGTGKECAARAIHAFSARRDGPFEAVNCGALPEALIESEFFGHERGAFTDAKTARSGFVDQAAGGTLMLDEVEALHPKAQVALLRFLESFEYRRVGGARTRHCDLRIISASNENLDALVRRGVFRRDLLYRLNVLSLTLPPLRDRPGDVELLAGYLLDRFTARYGLPPMRLTPAARQWLTAQRWPGNVRELENRIHRAVVRAADGHLSLGDYAVSEDGASLPPFNTAKRAAIQRFEQQYVTELLQQTGGNVTRAARLADKERRCFGRLLAKHSIEADAFKPRP
ncbi:MAG: sigma-54 dependent transcriptional regulator [Pseudomonadota bacterium]